MRNVKDLRKTASDVVSKLMTGTIDVKNAKVIVAALNTMISSTKAQLLHYKAMGKKSKIAFLITE